jgi:hypothetical protein
MPICAMPCDEETRRIKVGFASPPEQRELETLSVSELGLLAETLALAEIFGEAALPADAHIPSKGSARITCENACGERVTISLLPPGPIPEFPLLPFRPVRFPMRGLR